MDVGIFIKFKYIQLNYVTGRDPIEKIKQLLTHMQIFYFLFFNQNAVGLRNH